MKIKVFSVCLWAFVVLTVSANAYVHCAIA
jgi:hypothetical protein